MPSPRPPPENYCAARYVRTLDLVVREDVRPRAVTVTACPRAGRSQCGKPRPLGAQSSRHNGAFEQDIEDDHF